MQGFPPRIRKSPKVESLEAHSQEPAHRRRIRGRDEAVRVPRISATLQFQVQIHAEQETFPNDSSNDLHSIRVLVKQLANVSRRSLHVCDG